jgi:transposase
MDNLTPHKNEETLALIEAVGVSVWFLPAYSPDINPIEEMWIKVKQASRSLEPRTHEQLLDAIAHALSWVPPSDARNWFASCGYSVI